jgi:hypothetical protein
MKTTSSVLLISLVFAGCQFSKSVKKDLISGLTTTGNVLSCDDVFLSVNSEKTTRNSFLYGETIIVNYNDIQGFTKVNGYVFPSMEIIVIDEKGDTLMYSRDLYSEYPDGINYSPLLLSADLTIASPIRSKGEYTLFVNISDKKGPGTYSSKLKFSVKSNEQLITEPSGVSISEVYLFSQGLDRVITDGKIKFDDNIYIIIEGLKGFKEENGFVFPGLSLLGTDSMDNNILDIDDLFKEYTETGIAVSDFISRVSAHFKITGSEFKNPLHCELVIWDKKSDARMRVATWLTLE